MVIVIVTQSVAQRFILISLIRSLYEETKGFAFLLPSPWPSGPWRREMKNILRARPRAFRKEVKFA